MTGLLLLPAALLVVGNGLFVAAEFALVSVRRSQIEPPAAAGSARARRVLDGLERLPRMMAAAQFGVTVCSLTLGAVAEPSVAALLEPLFHAVGVPQPLTHPLGYALALAAVAFFHLVVGEMVPKNLAMAAPERTALLLGPGLVVFSRLCAPATAVLQAAARLVLRIFRVEPRDEVPSVFTSRQLTDLVADSRQAGLLDRAAQQRLSDALGLGARTVADVLLDHRALVTVGPEATSRDVEELTVRTGYSRFPVRAAGGLPGDPADEPPYASRDFAGYLHVKDVLDLAEPDRPVPRRLCRPMATLPAALPLDEALGAMRASASHLAAVADASGRVLGLAALEDVLEMLVGEVHDPAHQPVAAGPTTTLPAPPRPAGLRGVPARLVPVRLAPAHLVPARLAASRPGRTGQPPALGRREASLSPREAAGPAGDRPAPGRTAPPRMPA